MDANRQGRTARACRRAIFGLATAWLALPVATTEASPMRSGLAAREFATAGAPALPGRWSAFLAAGESTWATRQSPAFTLPVRTALLSLINGDPAVAAASPLVNYFVWRRNLNPARFDRYHPFIGPSLPQGFTPPIPTPDIPSTPVDPPLTPPVPTVIPPTVPEPSAFLVITLGAAGALVMRSRSRSAAA